MATDLVGNEKLQRFIQLLSDLNHETAEVFSTGKTDIFHKMNDTILEMYSIQHTGEEEAYTAIEVIARSSIRTSTPSSPCSKATRVFLSTTPPILR